MGYAVQAIFLVIIGYVFYLLFKRVNDSSGYENHNWNDSNGISAGGYCKKGLYNDEQNHNHENEMKVSNLKDPICGMYVTTENAISKRINGKTYYFCSENCLRKFEKDIKTKFNT